MPSEQWNSIPNLIILIIILEWDNQVLVVSPRCIILTNVHVLHIMIAIAIAFDLSGVANFRISTHTHCIRILSEQIS